MRLLKNIVGTISDDYVSSIKIIELTGELQYGTSIMLNSFNGYLQNYNNVINISELDKSEEFGLTTNKDNVFTDIKISY